ncbi:MAG: peptidoglycan DD-metalloendopeptidase family protein [Wenzhouxiangella sp.]
MTRSIFRLSTLLLLALLAPAVLAQSVYIWTDEAGVTHFTDRQPQTDREVRVQKAIAEPESALVVRQVGPDNDPQWLFRNRLHGPLAVRLSLVDEENVVSYPALPENFVLAAGEERELVAIGALEPRQGWQYRLQTESLPGDPAARHRPPEPYRVPFAPGERFPVSQAFGGEHSHNTPESHYAVDIAMPIGTPIHAARGGVVMDTARWFHQTGQDRQRYGPRANYIRILHDDGSMAVYAHLDYAGVDVHPGQRVAAGQRIGRSGNTGYSSGPHLHFVVQINRDMALVSVPFEFQGPDGRPVRPRQGLMLESR